MMSSKQAAKPHGTLRIAMVDGAIGGLTLAPALRKRGVEVNVYEQAPELTEIEVAVALSANSVAAEGEFDVNIPDDDLERFQMVGDVRRRVPSNRTKISHALKSLARNTMLYHVRMDVRPPHDVDPTRFDQLKAEEKARAQELQRIGKWRHLWRIAGLYSNISVFDVESHDEMHAILTSLPLFPFMEISVTPLARHPSAID